MIAFCYAVNSELKIIHQHSLQSIDRHRCTWFKKLEKETVKLM